MTATSFRSVDVNIDAPVRTWPAEAIQTALDRGRRSDWARLAAEIRRSPWGEVSRTIETVSKWEENYGVDQLMLTVIKLARDLVTETGRATQARRLRQLRLDAGLTLEQLATLAGTSAPRLSAYENGKVSPTTDVIARLEHAARIRP
jgi:DNA-binding transcriptional regulator YiaG